ncbi:MAG: hypothetical protein HC866_04245 [Leptolyngbyaceae cyanobacterium RU_5_1]|nr:hypothetical protein [Leptolyngbyaceae cyanobacterium RU_5_1]
MRFITAANKLDFSRKFPRGGIAVSTMMSKTGWLQQKSALDLEIEKLDELSLQGTQIFYLDGRKIHSKEDF